MRNGSWTRLGVPLALLTGLLAGGSAAQAQILTRNLIYNSVQPCRVFDTRSSTAGILAGSTGRTFNIVGGNVTATTFTGQGGTNGGCGLPGFTAFVPFPRVQAVVINLTVVGAAGAGFLIAWPSDQPMPATSVINYTAGTTLANAIVLPVRQDTQGGDISIFAGVSGTHVVGDVTGYFSDSSTTSSASGSLNLFLGKNAGGTSATSASDNVGIGAGSLPLLTTGSGSVAIGALALSNLATGSNNIGIGLSGGQAVLGSNNIEIGNAGTSSDSGAIRIGTPGTHTSTFIAGINGVTSSSGTAVYVNGSGQLGTFPSSLRFKEDVADVGAASQELLQLRPVSFHYKPQYDDGSRIRQYGLVAEEVAKVDPNLVQYDEEGRPLAVRYQFVNAMLLNEVQSLHRQVEQLAKQIDEMKRQDGALQP